MNKPGKTGPFVSVIVPVFNEEHRIRNLLNRLLSQTYPRKQFEIIVIDNMSTDRTREFVSEFPVILLEQNRIKSSYASRNMGLQVAKGKIIAFTDGDCTPDLHWLEEGIKAIMLSGYSLAGGQIKFSFSHPRSLPASEIYDSISNMQQEEAIRNRNIAFTSNLFVGREVFKKIGLFDPDIKSGGDFLFTHIAIQRGFRIKYAKTAIVEHPARGFSSLMKKGFRIGLGKGQSSGNIPHNISGIKSCKPHSMRPHFSNLIPWHLFSRLKQNGIKVSAAVFLQVIYYSWAYVFVGAIGMLSGRITRRWTVFFTFAEVA